MGGIIARGIDGHMDRGTVRQMNKGILLTDSQSSQILPPLWFALQLPFSVQENSPGWSEHAVSRAV